MEKVRLEILGVSSSHSQRDSFALVLAEVNGNRRLPIIIGNFEAQAIALELEQIRPNRPMTHDLIVTLIQTLGIVLDEVYIYSLKEGVFYSRLIMSRDGMIFELESRPSDAAAIAVRYKAPIFTTETILEEAGIVVQDVQPAKKGNVPELEEDDEEDSAVEEAERLLRETQKSLNKEQMIRALNERIDNAIKNENYEEAARLRDEINKIEKTEN